VLGEEGEGLMVEERDVDEVKRALSEEINLLCVHQRRT
jgi:hypothetical protein